MNREFRMFGERPFDGFARERFTSIFQGIERMADSEILKYENDFEALVEKTVSDGSISKIEISFDNKEVRPFGKRLNNQQERIFVEYSVTVSSNSSLLDICPYVSGYLNEKLVRKLNNGSLIFNIDTGYHNSFDFPPEKMRDIESMYLRIKDFITNTTHDLNTAFDNFNSEIAKHSKLRLEMRLKKAQDLIKAKSKLNF